MEILPNARNAWGDSIDFEWPEGGGGTIYGSAHAPCTSLMINRPSETTIDFFAALCRERGWLLADGEGPLDVGDPGSSESVLMAAGVEPFQQIGEPGWERRTRLWLEAMTGEAPVPHSAEAIAAAEERLGRPLPPLWRTWYTELGDVALRALTDLQPFAETERYAGLSPEDQNRWRDAIATSIRGDEIVETRAPYDTHDFYPAEPVRRPLPEFLRWTLDQF